jgi:16S rRNA processing protein RimM
VIEYVVIGKVLGQGGKNNEIRVSPLTDNPKRFPTLKRFYITLPDQEPIEFKVHKVRFGRKKSYFLSITANFNYPMLEVGTLIKVPIDDIPPAEEGAYYYFQLEGLTVQTLDGNAVGVVKEIMKTGGNDVFIVEDGGNEYLVPFIGDVVKQIDLQKNTMIIAQMEGLFE